MKTLDPTIPASWDALSFGNSAKEYSLQPEDIVKEALAHACGSRAGRNSSRSARASALPFLLPFRVDSELSHLTFCHVLPPSPVYFTRTPRHSGAILVGTVMHACEESPPKMHAAKHISVRKHWTLVVKL